MTTFLIQLIALPLLASILGPPRCHHCCRAFSHPVPLSSRPVFVRPAKSSNPVIMAAETTPPGDHHHRSVVDEDDDDYDDYDDDDNEEEEKEDEGSSPPAWYTPLPSIGPLVSEAHATYRSGRTRPLAFRDAQLRGVERLVRNNAGALCRAVRRDLGQSRNYVELFELDLVSSRCRVARASLGGWSSTSRVPTPWPHNLAAPVRSEVVVEPRGVATLITPWNMPVLLALSPLVDALAAGNVCVLKMSELSHHTTQLLTDLLSSGEYVDADVVRVVNGGADVGSELLRHRVDAISYTGGGGGRPDRRGGRGEAPDADASGTGGEESLHRDGKRAREERGKEDSLGKDHGKRGTDVHLPGLRAFRVCARRRCCLFIPFSSRPPFSRQRPTYATTIRYSWRRS